nr:MAG TPA: hypothetical protein [Caudoviricetes sp.]
MLNIEKYKEAILNSPQTIINCCVKDLIKHGERCEDCRECKERVMKWLLEECKETILDDVEKKYLSAVIKPFRKNVSYIEKIHSKVDTYDYICVRVNRCEIMFFPKFEENTMYKGMELGRKYTLEELGL